MEAERIASQLTMKHSPQELFDLIYQYFPRGIPALHPGYQQTPEYLRLLAVQRSAADMNTPWTAMLQRLALHFPHFHLLNDFSPTRSSVNPILEYSASIALSSTADHWIEFAVSILAPYYRIQSGRVAQTPNPSEAPHVQSVFSDDTCFILPANATASQIEMFTGLRNINGQEHLEPDVSAPEQICPLSFELSPDEQPIGAQIADEIELTFVGYEPLPPAIGQIIVPGIHSSLGINKGVTIYECLMSGRAAACRINA